MRRPWGGACVVGLRNSKEGGVAGAELRKGDEAGAKVRETFAEATSCIAPWAIVMTLAIFQVRWEPWQGPEKGVTCSDLTHSHLVSPTGKLRHREVSRCARIPQLGQPPKVPSASGAIVCALSTFLVSPRGTWGLPECVGGQPLRQLKEPGSGPGFHPQLMPLNWALLVRISRTLHLRPPSCPVLLCSSPPAPPRGDY